MFEARREQELAELQAELQAETYRPGSYHAFEIPEPKRRLISAAPYRDRVVHHALCRIIEPIFERTFSPWSYANRVGYGTHRALRRFTTLLRGHEWVLRGDIRQFFPSLDHAILKEMVERKIRCRRTLNLIGRILDGSNEQDPLADPYFPGDDLLTPAERRCGLPIGNLTSQFFANVYLTGFDHYVVEHLGQRAYVRYVDDFAVFSDDQALLSEVAGRLSGYLQGLRLKLHPAKTQLRPTRLGSHFVGYYVLPDRVRVRNENLRRGRRRLRAYQQQFAAGDLTVAELTGRIRCWIAHLDHADTWRLREQLFAALPFIRMAGREDGAGISGPARGLVEQQPEQPPLCQPQQEHSRQPEQQHRVPVGQHSPQAGTALRERRGRAGESPDLLRSPQRCAANSNPGSGGW